MLRSEATPNAWGASRATPPKTAKTSLKSASTKVGETNAVNRSLKAASLPSRHASEADNNCETKSEGRVTERHPELPQRVPGGAATCQ
jgi:hypothetical protein